MTRPRRLHCNWYGMLTLTVLIGSALIVWTGIAIAITRLFEWAQSWGAML